MIKKTIAVLFGGCSPEYEISLESAYGVTSNIDKEKYEIILIGITKDGDWYKYEGSLENIKQNTWRENGICTKVVVSNNRSDKGIFEIVDGKLNLIQVDAIFPILHGQNGEDGTVQGLIELIGIPLIGCGTLPSALCMDKYLAHKLVEPYGIKVAKGILINKNTTKNELESQLTNIKYPIFVKPIRAGSSFGITKVCEQSKLNEAIEKAFKYDYEVLLEENVEGIELGCAILGNDDLIVGEVDEISLSKGFFNYEEKYTLKTSKIYCPARIDKDISDKVKETAKKIYTILKCKDYARIDMFLTKDNEIYFNEVNTIPGFTSHSRYPNMMKQTGLEFKELVDKIISLQI